MYNERLWELFMGDGYFTISKKLAREIGIQSAILYADLTSKYKYFRDRGELTDDGFFFNTIENIEQDTTLKEKVQRECIKKLSDFGLIEYKVAGMPAKRYFKVVTDDKVLMKVLKWDSQFSGNDGTSSVKSTEQVPSNRRNKFSGNDALINNNNNNKENKNNHIKDMISDKSLNAQSTLFDIHKSVQSESVQSSAKKKKTQRELAWEKIEQARSGIISWEKVRPRDFTYYFVDKHNELLSGQPLFQPYKNGTYVKLFRENFIEAYNIPNDKVCEYIDEFLNQYKTHPKSWGYITWGMIEKHKPLMDEIMYHVQKALRVVERQFEYNSFGLKEKTNLSNSERSDEVF